MKLPAPFCKYHLRLPLAGALMLSLLGCGGSSSPETVTPPSSNGAAVSRPGELGTFVQGQLRTLSAQGRLNASASLDGRPATAMALLPTATASAAPAPSSSTLVQEAGVDEADLIQTDGRYLYTVQPQTGSGARVAAYERGTDGRAVALSSVTLPRDGANDINTDGMMFSADQRTLAVISQHWTLAPASEICVDICPVIAPQWLRNSVNVQRVDVANPSAVAAGERISIDGYLVDSRRIGDSLYVVTHHRPVLALWQMPSSATPAEREAAIARLSAADLLPKVRRNGGASESLLADTDCYVQTSNASTTVEFTTITVFDLKSPTLARKSRCVVGGSEALYMSTGNLYLATTRWAYPSDVLRPVYPTEIKTDIHKFALEGGTVAFKGQGQVSGHLGWDREKKSFRLSEHNGDLRVLTFTGSFGWFALADATTTPPSPALLTVLRERASDQTLQAVATLPNAARPASIGKVGEQVYAVRFLGERAYVVTFRRTDPLYVLDLSNPADPKTVGALEVAGFSEYLFPLANNLLLGVGRDADSNGRATGLKVALFDVADPAKAAQSASLSLGTTGSSSALTYSRHGLNMLVLNNVARLALPVTLSSSAYADWQHGLQKLEVDTSAKTLRNLGLVGGSSGDANASLWLERSAQIGDSLYYLSGSNLGSYAW